MRPGGLIVGALQGSHPALDPVVPSDALLPGKTRAAMTPEKRFPLAVAPDAAVQALRRRPLRILIAGKAIQYP